MEIPKNYRKEEFIIDPLKANLYSFLITIPISIVMGLLYYLIWKEQFSVESLRDFAKINGTVGYTSATVLTLMLVGIILHELIHGITWSFFAKKGFKSIRFGFIWKALTPYCHCNEPLLVKQYIIGGVMPGIVLGLCPVLFGLIIGHLGITFFGLLFTIAAGGDLLIIHSLRKEKSTNLVQDHPTKIGCFIFREIIDEGSYS